VEKNRPSFSAAFASKKLVPGFVLNYLLLFQEISIISISFWISNLFSQKKEVAVRLM
jgi:hypothetical protein